MKFNLKSTYSPAGDQPKAIKKLSAGLKKGLKKQTLLGVTGSGKTFTIAQVIEKSQMPTLVIAHNKTLAAQLCSEFRQLFPQNAVEYFVSYYDYYQPEAYIPSSDTYIEKEAQINAEIERLRHSCTQALLSRKDVIIVASVSAIYGLGSPEQYQKTVLHLQKNQKIDRRQMLSQLIDMQFERTNGELSRGKFRLRGQIFEIMPVNQEIIFRLEISDKIDLIESVDPISKKVQNRLLDLWLFPAVHYIINEKVKEKAINSIKKELKNQLAKFKRQNKLLEYERLKRKVKYDLEMIENIGYCNGIENYSRHFDNRATGQPPFTLLDYFHENNDKFLTVIDESHVTLPQIRAMYNGDRARKKVLINHGFRLPSAKDNRPLTFDEFEEKTDFSIYTSATPAEYEITHSDKVVEQIVRPTGLVDPLVDLRPIIGHENKSQVEDLIEEVETQAQKGEKTLVTTLTKKMAEDLTDYLKKKKIKVSYLHSGVDTLQRIKVITDLRKDKIDVIIGVNLLREGLDIPEVSLVAILDADKEGFLRNETSLIQTIGRAARNVNGRVILYADNLTGSIKKAIEETERRRKKQLAYNKKHGITPKTIEKTIKNILQDFGLSANKSKKGRSKSQKNALSTLEVELEADKRPISQIIKNKQEKMKQAAKNLDFESAAVLRDEIRLLKLKKEK